MSYYTLNLYRLHSLKGVNYQEDDEFDFISEEPYQANIMLTLADNHTHATVILSLLQNIMKPPSWFTKSFSKE